MRKVLVFLFLLTVFFLAFLPVFDTDFGWHYRCGQELLTTGKLCTTNAFSYYLADYRAYNPSFLYDLLLAVAFDLSGFIGVSFIGALLIVLSAGLFLALTKGKLLVRMAAFLLLYIGSSIVFNLGLRSQLMTYVFFLLLLWLMKKHGEGHGRYLFAVPVLMVLWVNTHIGFFVGLAVFAAYVIHVLTRSRFKRRPVLFLTGLLLVSTLATFLNPFGPKVYLEIFAHAASPLSSMIAEWLPPPLTWKLFIVFSTLIVSIYHLARKKLNVFYLLLMFFFAFLALTGRRNIPLFMTVFFLDLLDMLPRLKVRLPPELIVPLLTAIAVSIAFIRIPAAITSSSWSNYCRNRLTNYPCEVVERNLVRGNIFANYEWGGFFVWQMPQSKVFVDGRMPAWKNEDGISPYAVYLSIVQTRPGWNELLKATRTDFLVISPQTFLDVLLTKEGHIFGWEELFRSSSTVVYESTSR